MSSLLPSATMDGTRAKSAAAFFLQRAKPGRHHHDVVYQWKEDGSPVVFLGRRLGHVAPVHLVRCEAVGGTLTAGTTPNIST